MKKLIKFKSNEYLLLKGGEIFDIITQKNSSADILIQNGQIVEIGKIKDKENYHTINCENNIITQAFVDVHSHFRTPGIGDQETFESGSYAALAGGYSRVCIMPDTDPIIDNAELVNFISDKASSLPIKIYPIGAITKQLQGNEISELGSMIEAGAIAISDSKFPIMNGQVMRYAMEYAKMFNVPIINHPEDINLVNQGVMNESATSNSLGLNGNPSIAESSMVYRDLEITSYVEGKIHLPSITCSKSIQLINEYKNRGLNITAEVNPQNLFFTDKDLIDYNTNFKISPPIRSLEDQNELIKGLKSGVLDCIASNHKPQRLDDKEKDFYHAEFGSIGLETAFAAVNTVLSKQKFSFNSIINLFSTNPSKIMGIELSEIKNKSKSELVVIDPKKEWIFNENSIFSKSKNTPFLNQKFVGKINFTIHENNLFG